MTYRPLTLGERRLLAFMADELTLETIAERLDEPVTAIEARVTNIIAKLDAHDGTQAVFASIVRSGQGVPEQLAERVAAIRARGGDLQPRERDLLLAYAAGATIDSLMARLGAGSPAEAIRLGLWAGLHHARLDGLELKILRHAVLGHAVEQCVSELELTTNSALYDRRTAIFAKLDVEDLTGAVAAAIRSGQLLPVPELKERNA
jgi:DNA-binding NarL/FixJ family response regulator